MVFLLLMAAKVRKKFKVEGLKLKVFAEKGAFFTFYASVIHFFATFAPENKQKDSDERRKFQ